MDERYYRMRSRSVDGQEMEVAGVQVHLQELNELVLFRCPPDTTDKDIEGLRELLNEAYADQDPNKVIIARGAFDLRLERISIDRPATLTEQREWIQQEIDRLKEELDGVEGKLGFRQTPFGDRLRPEPTTFVPRFKAEDLHFEWSYGSTGKEMLIKDRASGFETRIIDTDPWLEELTKASTPAQIQRVVLKKMDEEADKFRTGHQWTESGVHYAMDTQGTILGMQNGVLFRSTANQELGVSDETIAAEDDFDDYDYHPGDDE